MYAIYKQTRKLCVLQDLDCCATTFPLAASILALLPGVVAVSQPSFHFC